MEKWEYAARAGNPGARYGELERVAWYNGNSDKQTHEVAQKQANAWGLYDMLGNVWEWTSDLYPNTTSRILRGGSWVYDPRGVRASFRYWLEPALRINNLGFRCAGELH